MFFFFTFITDKENLYYITFYYSLVTKKYLKNISSCCRNMWPVLYNIALILESYICKVMFSFYLHNIADMLVKYRKYFQRNSYNIRKIFRMKRTYFQ